MKTIITTMADSASDAIQQIRDWYETLEIQFLRAPVASKAYNSDQCYRVIIWTEK